MRDLQQLDQLKVLKLWEDSDEMIKKRRFQKYNEAEMNREYEFPFKDAIKEHALLNGQDIRFRKNDKVRCRVVCKGKGKVQMDVFCKVGGSDCFRIKTLKGKHSYGRNYSERLVSSNWISKKITNNINKGEKMKLATIIKTIQDKYMGNISVDKAYWARRKEREEVHRWAILQYTKLRDYCIAMEWQARWARDLKFEIHHKNKMIMEMFVVDLMAERCSCRFWVCVVCLAHMLAVQFLKRVIILRTIAVTTTVQQHTLLHMGKHNQRYNLILSSPIFRVKPRRPRIVRIREPNENISQIKYRRIGTSVTCSNCSQYGHNKRHCPNSIVIAPEGIQGSDVAAGNGGSAAANNEASVAANESGVSVAIN
ncbi:hypothetical protein Ahy_B06g082031 isoform A [Arachis hypogaea]|uniref:CCHC-type domain-containing protein n=1 Tax=Arachis hypogaea TaxID=3818 RepID=A0A444YMR6_ARAHY|nr:hypothetical protein Ahy_B06g082031 isoform A [Arachis hypogaea]